MSSTPMPDLTLPKFLDRTRLIWTYTMLHTYRDVCAHQAYRRYVKRDIPYVETPQMRWGNEVHSAMELRIGGNKQLPDSMRQWEPIAAAFDGKSAKVEMKLAIDRNGHPCEYFDNAKVWGRGKGDVVLVNGETAYLGDHKTGKVKEDPFELEVHAMLLHAKFPHLKKIVGQFLWLKEDRPGQLHDLSDTRKTWEEVSRLYGLMLQDRANDTWEKRRSGLCSWCACTDCENWKPRQ